MQRPPADIERVVDHARPVLETVAEQQPEVVQAPPQTAAESVAPLATQVVETAPAESLSPSTRAILADQTPISQPVPVDVCAGTEGFLADFSRHYQDGDLDRYLHLYAEDAVENKAQGRAAILNIYEPFFGSTSNRVIDLKVTSTDSSSQDLCILAAEFSAQYFNQTGQRMGVSAQIQFQLTPAADGGVLISCNTLDELYATVVCP